MRFGKLIAVAGLMMASSVPALAQNWAGNWGGITLGFGSGSYDLGVSALSEPGPTVDVDGAQLGLRYARNWQRGNYVFGADVEASTGLDGINKQSPIIIPEWICRSGDCNVTIKSLVTIRGRFGLLVNPETLVYAAGGIATGKVEGGIANSPQQGSSTATGYTIGFGAEHFIREKITIFGEVNYVDLGNLEFGEGDTSSDVFDGVGDFMTIKLGASFRF